MEPKLITTEEEKAESRAFYREAITMLNETGAPFMLGGAFAMFHYTGLYRDTKDLDVFCKSSDIPRILKYFQEKGYRTEWHDVRWIAKIFKGDYFIDLIYDTVNNICRVDDSWLEHASEGEFADMQVKFLPAEELVWCKSYVWNRERYDGADVNHILLRHGKKMDWHRLLRRMDPHWHLLLAELLMFQFVYPSDFHEIIPKWLFEELMNRANDQYLLPPPQVRVCRGPIVDNTQYSVDIKEWNYKSCTIKTV